MTALLANDHVQLAIPEGGEDSARAFFVDLIGMREVAKPDTLSPQGCWFAAGEVALHLGVDPRWREIRDSDKYERILAFGAALPRLRARLEQAGVACRDDKPVAGYRRFFTADPFGNRLEFMQKV